MTERKPVHGAASRAFAQQLHKENKALRDERDWLREALERLSGIMPHQHCHSCNQFADNIKAALRRAKAEGWREAAKLTDDHVCNEEPFWNCECRGVLGNLFDARAAQIEQGE